MFKAAWKRLREFFSPAIKAVQKNTPLVLRTRNLDLPKWAKLAERSSDLISVTIDVDTDGYIEDWFYILGVTQPDQYWLEVAYQCAKLDLQAALENTQFDPRYANKPAEFHFLRSPKWALNRFQTGKGIGAASQGKEARGHYKRLRGKLPLE